VLLLLQAVYFGTAGRVEKGKCTPSVIVCPEVQLMQRVISECSCSVDCSEGILFLGHLFHAIIQCLVMCCSMYYILPIIMSVSKPCSSRKHRIKEEGYVFQNGRYNTFSQNSKTNLGISLVSKQHV
jgi:hypothetical protein